MDAIRVATDKETIFDESKTDIISYIFLTNDPLTRSL